MASVVGSFYETSYGGSTTDILYPTSSYSAPYFKINPNGGNITMRTTTDHSTIIGTITSTYTFNINTYSSSGYSGNIKLHCLYNAPTSTQTLNAVVADTGN